MNQTASRIIAHYERHALAWDADRRAAAWSDKPHIARFLALLQPGDTVLDLGCGGGVPVASHMTAQGFSVTGVDSSPTLVGLCRSRMPAQDWIVADMRSLTCHRRFDGVLAWDSFFHLGHDDQRRMFPVFAACVARGGILMFNAGPAHGEAIGSYRGDPLYHASLDPSEYLALLSDNGFELIENSIGNPARGERIVWIARAVRPEPLASRDRQIQRTDVE
jgi:predicted TPR repeat methyltransferase